MFSHAAIRATHVGGHVAMAVVPYFPHPPVPIIARERFRPWACTFHCRDGAPVHFVAFGGRAGMIATVHAILGPLLLQMHGGLFEALADRVPFDLDNAPLHGDRLAAVAYALDAFIASPSFAVDCYLIGVDGNAARLNLETIRTTIEAGHSLLL